MEKFFEVLGKILAISLDIILILMAIELMQYLPQIMNILSNK